MNFDFTGKHVIVTGGANGIGLAIARSFAGCWCVGLDRGPTECKA